jgi:Tfp pilus assembly protein PilF
LLIFVFVLAGCGPKEQSKEPGDPKGTNVERKASSFRALKLLEGSRFDEAWDECQKILLQSPNDTRALYVAANVLNQRKKLDQALQIVDRIPLNDPEYGLLAHREGMQWSNSNVRLAF